MHACACLGPKPGHRYCPCREKAGEREPFHVDAGPVHDQVKYDKIKWSDGMGGYFTASFPIKDK